MPSVRLLDALDILAAENPESIALVAGDRRVSYRQLHTSAAEFADVLNSDAGLDRSRPLCVPAHKNVETIALVLGAFRAGFTVLAPSPELGAESLDTLCAQARCSRILAADPDGLHQTPVPADEVLARDFAWVDPDRAKLLLTTSGSTGTPKIVPVGADAFDRFADWASDHFELTDADVSLSYAPLNFDLSLLDVWTMLRLGARVVLVDQSLSTDTPYLRGLVAEHEVTFIQGVPLLYRLIAQSPEAFPHVRTGIVTGDMLPQELLPQLSRAFPGAGFHNVFGCTETNDSFIHRIDLTAEGAKIPIGRPITGVVAAVVDSDDKVLVGPGTGELLVSTPFQTDGYLQRSRNEGVFVAAPDGGEGVFYRTGDIVTRDAVGCYVLEGRTDFQVKVRGVRTNVLEVESVLAAHPDVAEAVVVAIPHEQAGYQLHAHITRQPGSKLSSLRLRSHSARHLPRHAIPSSVAVVDEPSPRTPTGKPDRNLIKQTRMEAQTA